MSDMFPESFNTESVSFDDQLKEIDRELAMRARCYPGWVAKGTLKQETADKNMLVMRAVRQTVVNARQQALMTSKLTGKTIGE